METAVLAIDIGGTKTAAAIVTREGEILSRSVVPTLQQGPEQGVLQLIRLLEEVQQRAAPGHHALAGIGAGIPAVLEPGSDHVIWGPNLQGWRGVDLRGPLEAHFHLPAAIEYDGHAAVLGECWKGAGQGCSSVVSVIIGTGVGGGMVLEGRLVRGVNRLAGASGWFVMGSSEADVSGEGRSLGNWEAHIAGPGIARRAQELLAERVDAPGRLWESRETVRAEDVFAAAQAGDPLARELADETARLTGLGLANIVSLVNPEVIVLGGGVGSHLGFLLPQIQDVLRTHAQPISAQSVRVVTSTLGGDAGLLGAAAGILLRLNQFGAVR